MTAFVLDASVTASWLLPDEQSEQSDRVYAKLRASLVDAHAPDLWLWECSNIIANDPVKCPRYALSPAVRNYCSRLQRGGGP